MSEENVEIVRAIFEAVGRGDSAAVQALYDPSVELDNSRSALLDLIGDGVYHGHEGLREFDRELKEAFGSIETDCRELIDAGERVVAVASYRARGRASGVEVNGPDHFGVWTIRNGRVIRIVWFPTKADALEAAALSE